MPVSKTPKDVRQMQGLTGYYCKFIPPYSGLVRLLTQMTPKTEPFIWADQCQKAFKKPKDILMKRPILDPNILYLLFTGASKYAWSAVLTQECATVIDV